MEHTEALRTFQIAVQRRIKQTAVLMINACSEEEARAKADEALAYGKHVPWVDAGAYNHHDALVEILEAVASSPEALNHLDNDLLHEMGELLFKIKAGS